MADNGRGERDRARTLAIGRRVRELRTGQGITQETLAERARVHRAVIGFVERGEREPGVSLVWRLADGLGVSLAALLESIEDTVVDQPAPARPPRARRERQAVSEGSATPDR